MSKKARAVKAKAKTAKVKSTKLKPANRAKAGKAKPVKAKSTKAEPIKTKTIKFKASVFRPKKATSARAKIAWPKKTREMHNHHMNSTVWNTFKFRDDDIVVATYAKSGTTWTQQIIAQLIFNGAEGIDVHSLSPWVDLRIIPPEVIAGLEAQAHRRFVKTHLPVDALVFSPKAKYIFIGRDGRVTRPGACLTIMPMRLTIISMHSTIHLAGLVLRSSGVPARCMISTPAGSAAMGTPIGRSGKTSAHGGTSASFPTSSSFTSTT